MVRGAILLPEQQYLSKSIIIHSIKTLLVLKKKDLKVKPSSPIRFTLDDLAV